MPNPKFDTEAPTLPADLKPGGVLIYSKTNGFREEAAIQASDTALAAIAHERNWPYFVTENGAVMNKEQLAKFKVVDLEQQQRRYADAGTARGFQNLDGERRVLCGDSRRWRRSGYTILQTAAVSLADWPWYIETLLGAQFTSHSPQQFGDAHVEDTKSPLTKGLPAVFNRRTNGTLSPRIRAACRDSTF